MQKAEKIALIKTNNWLKELGREKEAEEEAIINFEPNLFKKKKK